MNVSRRELLKNLAALGVGATLPRLGHAAASQSPIERYLDTLARPDGGYAFDDQANSHLTPTFAVIGCHRILGRRLPDPIRLAEFVRTHHPSHLKKLEQERRVFEFQQVQSLVWLGADTTEFRAKIAAWKQPNIYLKQYEQHGYPIFQSELGAITCRALLELPLEDLSPHFTTYLDERRRANGSFNNTPASDTTDGHVMNTYWGLQALRVLGRSDERKDETVAWLQACQLPSGGFTWQPKAELAGIDDVAYTRAAVCALSLLGAEPADRERCMAFLLTLENEDGGYADRPGWLSNPLATYYALDAMQSLGWDGIVRTPRRMARRSARVPETLKVFSIQLEAHGKGSPAEAVDLARGLRIHLWGSKNATPAWLACARTIANRDQVPVRFFVSNEEYGTWMSMPGLGTYSHMSDIIAPNAESSGGSLANTGVVSWPEFRERRLDPLRRRGGRLVWQFGENEELVRLLLDDSVERGGYAAISTFHFGNPDFMNTEPFLQRWRGQLPYVALQDAHGGEPWWFADTTAGFRTVFLASEPTWDGWLEALQHNRVAAVRHDAVSRFETWMHAGSREVAEFIRAREGEWRWWDNPAIDRPLVSIVAVKPEDEFEVGRPTSGVTLRIRCAWGNTPQGLLKTPLAELLKLTIDDAVVAPELVSTKAPNGRQLSDQYHRVQLAKLEPGKHRATAWIRVLATDREASRTLFFES